jgi:predicted RNase H-like HicB family nuclease
MTKQYLGVVEKDLESAYGIWFPDMPGCFPAADELDDLPRVAEEALRQHIGALASNRLTVPTPRSISEVMSDKHVRDALRAGATTMLVSS